MKKILLVALVSVFAFGFTGCNKEEDLPEPQETVVAPTPVASTTTTNNYIKGAGWSGNDPNLKIETAANVQVFWNNLSSSPNITINLNETYNYTVVCNPMSINVTGTYKISDTGTLTYSGTPSGVISFFKDSQGVIYISKI